VSGAAWHEDILKVHVIFKTHLDIGFTDLAANVVQKYVRQYIPAAIQLARETRERQTGQRFRWTTGAWLIRRYLEVSDEAGRHGMEEAIAAGDMNWHALPFTLHSEVLEPSLFALGTELSRRLDERFGRKTIAAKMTDVPGHTRGIVPILQKAAVQLLHIGVNPASTPPDVPAVFVWHAPDDSRVVVMYQKDYGGVLRVPHTSEAVAILFTGDNHGPQTADQVNRAYEQLQQQFPNARVVASDLNEVARTAVGVSALLPVVRSEQGDSWIHGIGSDPKKIAELRELSRLRNRWIQSGRLPEAGNVDLAFGAPLLQVAEHTWGLDVKTHLQSWEVYTPEALQAARNTPRFLRVEASWQEKRNYIEEAIQALPEAQGAEARSVLARMKPRRPHLSRYEPFGDLAVTVETPGLSIALDPATGALKKLRNRETGRDWASAAQPLAWFAYETFAPADYERFFEQYLTQRPGWALQDFGKPGFEKFEPRHQVFRARLVAAWCRETADTRSILVEQEVVDEQGLVVPGCPRSLTTEYQLSSKGPMLEINLQWFEKPATRLPEALWFSFVPRVDPQGQWWMDKMGQDVDPGDVVKDGGHKLHAVTDGVRYVDTRGSMVIGTWDAPLVAPGERSLLNFDNARPAVEGGMHFCLCNNVWGTNFVMWFDEDMQFRFRLTG